MHTCTKISHVERFLKGGTSKLIMAYTGRWDTDRESGVDPQPAVYRAGPRLHAARERRGLPHLWGSEHPNDGQDSWEVDVIGLVRKFESYSFGGEGYLCGCCKVVSVLGVGGKLILCWMVVSAHIHVGCTNGDPRYSSSCSYLHYYKVITEMISLFLLRSDPLIRHPTVSCPNLCTRKNHLFTIPCKLLWSLTCDLDPGRRHPCTETKETTHQSMTRWFAPFPIAHTHARGQPSASYGFCRRGISTLVEVPTSS